MALQLNEWLFEQVAFGAHDEQLNGQRLNALHDFGERPI
jgi:hypothetical protein